MWHDYQNQTPDYDQDIIVILAGGEGIFRGKREHFQNQDWINADKYGMLAAQLVHCLPSSLGAGCPQTMMRSSKFL